MHCDQPSGHTQRPSCDCQPLGHGVSGGKSSCAARVDCNLRGDGSVGVLPQAESSVRAAAAMSTRSGVTCEEREYNGRSVREERRSYLLRRG